MNAEQFRGMTLTGGYTVHNEEALGKGGFGVVYKGTYQQDQSVVGVKILLGDHGTPPNELLQKGFKKEAQTNSHLEHPHIARFLWYDVEHIVNPHLQNLVEEYPFIVLAYANKGSLGKLLEKQPLLPTEQTVDFLSQAAEGLQYAHERRVLHRDIKPHNFLLHKPHPKQEHIDLWVADFGIAVTAHDVNTSEPITPQVTIGTYKYESAEQFEGKAVIQSDIYSLGVVAYQLLTGTLPFTAKNFAEYYLAHKQKPPPSFAEARRGKGYIPDKIVDALEEAVMKALEKNPLARYRSMSDFSHTLHEAHTKAVKEAEKQRRSFEAAKPKDAAVAENKITVTLRLSSVYDNQELGKMSTRQVEIDLSKSNKVKINELKMKVIGLYFKKPKEAIEVYKELYKLDPRYIDPILGIARELSYLSSYEESIIIADEAIQLYGPNPDLKHWGTCERLGILWNIKAGDFESLGKPEEALQAYKKSFEIHPTNEFVDNHIKRLERNPEYDPLLEKHLLERWEESVKKYPDVYGPTILLTPDAD